MKVTTKQPKPATVKLATLKAGDTFMTDDLYGCQEDCRYILGNYHHTITCLETGAVWDDMEHLNVAPVDMEARDI